MQLPESVLPAEYVASRSKGGLLIATVKFFKVFQLVEQIVSTQLENKCHVYIKDSYETVIDHICELKLSNPCCENHPEILPFLIILIYRFHGFICWVQVFSARGSTSRASTGDKALWEKQP